MERVGRLGFTATFADRRERTISYDRISQAITPVMVVSHQIVVVKLIPYVRGSTLPARHVLAVQQETIWYVDCGRCHVRLDRRPSAVLDSQCHGLLSRSQCRSALLVRRLLRSLSDGRYGNGQVFKTASQWSDCRTGLYTRGIGLVAKEETRWIYHLTSQSRLYTWNRRISRSLWYDLYATTESGPIDQGTLSKDVYDNDQSWW